MNRSQIRDDIYLRVKPKPSEDDALHARHIDAIIDRFRSLFIAKSANESSAEYLDPSVISSYTEKIATPLAQEDCYKGYKVYTYALPSSVIDLPNDMGVYNVETTAGKKFKRIDRRDVSRFLKIPQASIDCTYYRIGTTIYMIKKNDLAKVAPKFNIDLVLADTLGVADEYIISDTAEYPVSDSMAAAIIEATVMELRKAGEQAIDYISDGVDE